MLWARITFLQQNLQDRGRQTLCINLKWIKISLPFDSVAVGDRPNGSNGGVA